MICDNLDHQNMLVYFPKSRFLCTSFPLSWKKKVKIDNSGKLEKRGLIKGEINTNQ